MNDITKNIILAGIVAVLLLSIFGQMQSIDKSEEMVYSEFIQKVEEQQIKSVKIDDYHIKGETVSGDDFSVLKPSSLDVELLPTLLANEVRIEGEAPKQRSILLDIFLSLLPILLIVGVFMFFMRQMQGGGGGGKGNPMSFGRSKAKLIPQDKIKTRFADVAGCDEAKEEVSEIVDFLKDPSKFNELGGRIPRGVLMVGPPGTGKTLLARAIAGEARVPFFTISGSDFVEMFVGVGASRVRDMFETAKKHAPCIIFIDEIDAVGRKRGGGNFSGGNDEREQTLNQLLVEMDGFGESDGVIVIAATNRADVLDKALLRPGRFDRQVTVGLPDIKGREQILEIHMKKVPLAGEIKASVIARGTPGFSGADLANLVNEAALFAARKNAKSVTMEYFEQAKDKIMMGAERRSMVMSEKEKEATAYHEAGHAIVGYVMPEHDPVHKVTIIPRGRALGVTHYLPEADKHSHSKRYLVGRLASAYGGRVAEEMIYGEDGVSTGAQSDIQYATQMARAMVTRWGYSDKLGPLLFDEENNGFSTMQSFSPETGRIIDEETRVFIDAAYSTAREVLKTHEDKLHAMKEALMKYETLNAKQVKQIMDGDVVDEPDNWHDDSTAGGGTTADKTPLTEQNEDEEDLADIPVEVTPVPVKPVIKPVPTNAKPINPYSD